jgi:two-component system sensor histidine kinase KdpD
MAKGLDAEFFVIHVERGDEGRTEDRRLALAENIRFAHNLGAQIVQIEGAMVAATVAQFVREYKITQVIFGRSAGHGWRKYLYLMAINRFLASAPSVDVHIVTQEES